MERLQSTYENYVDYNLSESGVQPMRARDLLQQAGGAEPFLSAELGYIQSNGTEELRDRIAAFYGGAARDNMLVTHGGRGADHTAFWGVLRRPDPPGFLRPKYLPTCGRSRRAGSAGPPV